MPLESVLALDIVLCFFYFKNKETRENDFYNVDFYERKKFEFEIKEGDGARAPIVLEDNKHSMGVLKSSSQL